MKSIEEKRPSKNRRKNDLLIGLIELYLKSGRPIGSQTLQESGFKSLSSATIRNYLSQLEEEGLLKQPHTSGGRVPTSKAFRFYVDLHQNEGVVEEKQASLLQAALKKERHDIFALLHRSAELLGELTQCAVNAVNLRFYCVTDRDIFLS